MKKHAPSKAIEHLVQQPHADQLAMVVEAIREADVVIGTDVETGKGPIFLGLERLEDIAGGRPQPVGLLRFTVDFSTTQPEWLALACIAATGSCDYGRTRSSDPAAPWVMEAADRLRLRWASPTDSLG